MHICVSLAIVLVVVCVVGVAWCYIPPLYKHEFTMGNIGSYILSIVAILFACYSGLDLRLRIKKEDFRIVQKYLSNDRAYFEYHAKTFLKLEDGYLLRQDGWLLEKPIRLEQLTVDLEKKCWNGEKIKNSKLPYSGGYSSNLMELTDTHIFFANTYALNSLQAKYPDSEHPRLVVKEGNYMDRLDCCDYAAYRLVYEMKIKRKDKVNIPKLLKVNPFELEKRFASIGICTLTIVLGFEGEEDKPYFLIHKRGNAVAEGQNAFHVVPAGEYQPLSRYTKGNLLQPVDSIVKEFYEEVLGMDTFGDICSETLLKKYKDNLNADYYYLGMGLDPLNLKAEMLTYMVLDLRTSPEFKNAQRKAQFLKKIKGNYEGNVDLCPLEKSYLDRFLENEVTIPACREILSKISKIYN